MSDRFQTPRSGWLRALGLFVGLLTVLRVWLGPIEFSPAAHAQLPDSGLQRRQLVEEARRTNELLVQILRTLEDRTLNVQIKGADKNSALPVRPKGG
jgi:hypothetical protein